MHTVSIAKWQHTHIFGQDQIRSGEQRTLLVITITGLMMFAEIVAGAAYGSMALFADGIHMGSHMLGLGISYVAYIYARKHALNKIFCFGTGKVNALAGYTSAIFLIIIAIYMGYESLHRFINPVAIEYNQAILVAVIGLVVNGGSMLILGEKGHKHSHEKAHSYNAEHEYAHEHEYTHDHAHKHDYIHDGSTHAVSADHNLRAAYLHVLADALTSVLAIVALLGAKYFSLNWMDPFMGVVGAFMVIRWSFGLIQGTVKVLLDHQVQPNVQQRIIETLESYKDTRVCDMHIWSIGPGIYSSEISVVTKDPEQPGKYKSLIPSDTGVVHSTIEVHLCPY